jgi:hypothetical protein
VTPLMQSAAFPSSVVHAIVLHFGLSSTILPQWG